MKIENLPENELFKIKSLVEQLTTVSEMPIGSSREEKEGRMIEVGDIAYELETVYVELEKRYHFKIISNYYKEKPRSIMKLLGG